MSAEVWAPGAAFIATAATGAASAEAEIRSSAPQACDVMLKASISTAASAQVSGFTIAFGATGMNAPADTAMILDHVDGWVKVRIPAGATHIRIKSPSTGGAAGTVRGYICDRPGA